MLSSLRNMFNSYNLPRDMREEATLGLFVLLLLMSCAALAMQARIVSTRVQMYTLECVNLRTQARSSFYGCPAVTVNSDHAWCGDVRIEGVCSAETQH